MFESLLVQKPAIAPPLDDDFRPAWLGRRTFSEAVRAAGGGERLAFALERGDGKVARFDTRVLPLDHSRARDNLVFASQVVKFLLWQKGGFRLLLSGPPAVTEHLAHEYSSRGERAFDAAFMADVYQRAFVVERVPFDALPEEHEKPDAVGGHLAGCRIGFDAGGSDRKVAAVIDGEEVFSTEVVWHPKDHSDPRYHIEGIHDSIRRAAAHLPRIDAIGVSSAGIYVDNRTCVASLFRRISPDDFDRYVRNIYPDVAERWGSPPLRVANDGDVAALAGALSLQGPRARAASGGRSVLGIALGTSQAAGYVDRQGLITGFLNELAFAPIDASPGAAVDAEWSRDRGVGSQYLSQDAVLRLAPRAGLELAPGRAPAARLKEVQELFESGDERPRPIYQSLGVYLGYALLHYADFYQLDDVLLLGRVMSGRGGTVVVNHAREVLQAEAPELAPRIALHLPDESGRRVGQSIAAASLPVLP